MRKRFFKEKIAVTSLLAVALLAGCSSNKASTDSGGEKVEPTVTPQKFEPVTLRLFNLGGTSQEDFDLKMKAPIEKKYPHIKLEFVLNVKGTTLPELAASNNLPDIVFGKVSDNDGLMMDMQPLFKKHNFDVNSVKPVLWETYKYLTDTDKKTLFVPLTNGMHLLHYNKDIFDRFGVAYPKDGMTWDQTYELAKKLARTDNGVKYLGFNFRGSLNLNGPQLLLSYYDEKTGKAAINTDGWKRYFANFSRFFEITGNEVTQAGNELNNDNIFTKDKRVAMYASHPLLFDLADLNKEGNDINWDIVSLPVFPEAPRQATVSNTNGLGITLASKHPDDAFLAIQTLLSDEVQLANSRGGYRSVLTKDEKQQKEYGKDYPLLNSKNVAAVFYNDYAPTPKFNNYNGTLKTIPYNYFRLVAWGTKDINTAIREAEDAMNKAIDTLNLTLKK